MKRWLAVMLTAAMIASGFGNYVLAADVDDEQKFQETEMIDESEDNNKDSTDPGMEAAEDVPMDASEEEKMTEVSGTEDVTEENQESQDMEYGTKLAEDDPEIGNRANSWRYSDGELKQDNRQSRAAVYAFHSNATRKGIDVSEWQGEINWEQVKASGVEFVILRCGWGMDIASQDDKYWARNVAECERLGIPYGVYLYSYATNTDRALSEAKHVLRLISGHTPTYPIYFDMEDDSTIGCDLGAIAETFCSTIKNAGYAVGVYANLNWWNNYLTDARFSQWHRWVAQYNSECNYTGSYAMWQYSSSGSVPGISGPVDMNYLIGYPADHGGQSTVDIPMEVKDSITYTAHLSDVGWMNEVSNGVIAGMVGQDRQMEAFKINLNNLSGVSVEYQAYVEKEGWQPYVLEGEEAGTTGQNRQIEALRVKLTGSRASDYNIYYRSYVEGNGWLDWTKNGQVSGTIGFDRQMEAFQIALLPVSSAAPGDTTVPFLYKDSSIELHSKAHVSEIGWQDAVENGDMIGTTGQNLGIEAYSVDSSIYGVQIRFSSYTDAAGWQDYVTDGETSGRTGINTPLQAVKMELAGSNKEYYHLYYRTHVSDYGWLDWTCDGAEAGNIGYGKKIEAIQILLLPADSEYAPTQGDSACMKKPFSILYATHVQDKGWQDYVENGETAGTTGQNKQVEALKIKLCEQPYDGGVSYATHVSDIGWQDVVNTDEIAGTVGQNRQVEAVRIELSGKIAEYYDIYYRVHASEFGWLDWAKNGENAGSEGYARQVEALEIRLVEKGGEAPGDTENAFMLKPTTVSYQAHVQDIGWQSYVENGKTAGTTGKNRQLEALKIQLARQEYAGGIQYCAHVSNAGWQNFVQNGEIAGTVGENKAIEAIAIRLEGDLADHFDIYYRVHASEFGWLGWAKNGENAGSQGYARHAEAIEIRLVEKGEAAPGETTNAFYSK